MRVLLEFAESGFSLIETGGEETSATFDLNTGVLSTGKNLLDIRMDQSAEVQAQVFRHEHLLAVKLAKNRVVQTLVERFDVTRKNIHLAAPIFFSKLTNTSQVEYSRHRITRDIHPAVFYTTVIQLKDHGKDFKGGRLIFVEDPPTNKSISSIEARAGRILGFTSGRENLHFVEKVTVGALYQLTFKFTCDESAAVQEPWKDSRE